MTLNDLVKQSATSVRTATQHYPRGAQAQPRVRGPVNSAQATSSALPTKLQRLARPSRKTDFYLGDETSEPVRQAQALGGLSAPRANASRGADKQTPPHMLAGAKPVAIRHQVGQPRAMTLEDVQGHSEALGHLQNHFDLVPVHGDGYTSLVAALLHHGAQHPARAAALAEGLRKLEEPTGEISPQAHAGFAMLKRWAQALADGRGADAKNDAVKHPGALEAMALALRGIVRHMQLFGGMKRPAKDKAGHAADMEGMHAVAQTCGLTLNTHSRDAATSAQTDGSALHLLAHSKPGQLDVLVPKS